MATVTKKTNWFNRKNKSHRFEEQRVLFHSNEEVYKALRKKMSREVMDQRYANLRYGVYSRL